MRRTEVLNGVRMLKFRDVFGRCEEGKLSKLEAAELLGINERTFRRWSQRYEEEGEAGLVDRRLGKPSPKRVPAAEAPVTDGHDPSSMTPALSHLRIRRMMRRPPIRCSTNRMSHSWFTVFCGWRSR
jgi:hypothetical protein